MTPALEELLLKVACSSLIDDGDRTAAARLILSAVRQGLAVDRASIWLYQGHERLSCELLDSRGSDNGQHLPKLSQQKFPNYFMALYGERNIVADDALQDPRTAEFASGYLQPLAIGAMLGLLAGLICLWGVTGLKKLLGADDSLDVFGVHGVCGILGALLTGVFNSPDLGGPGYVADWVTATMVTSADYSIAAQVWTQAKAVLLTIVWSGVVSFVAYKIVDLTVGLRVTEEDEREGLDITSHGETAYNR